MNKLDADFERRLADLELLQAHYSSFDILLKDVIENFLGFKCTDLQLDIGEFIANGPQYCMVQAQRGQAKTTIAAIYAVYCLIHNPTSRILIISAGEKLSSQISKWIINIIMGMPELECLRPDTYAGDRCAVDAFDVHFTLRGNDKTPSVACLGINSNLQGFRADLILADDVESSKNSQTAYQREKLTDLTREFSSICKSGRIVYLGTPQNADSIYNSLPARGFTVRVWPGRYPTESAIKNYGSLLAPLILQRIEDDPSLQKGGGATGARGKPTDPQLLDEDALTKKELDQGAAHFQLQHMLDTRLIDEDRYPLKLSSLVFMHVPAERAPTSINWAQREDQRLYFPQGFPINDAIYSAHSFGNEYTEFKGCVMYVDPAGGGANADETAYAVVKMIGGKLFVVDIGGLPGGYSPASLNALTAVAVKWKPNIIKVEENFGKGAFTHIWQPVLNDKYKCTIEEVWESGQKERRIIDVLEPIISSNKLVVDISLIEKDWASVQKYALEARTSYSMFYQLARITRDRGALKHDDRLDALASACRHWVDALAIDSQTVEAQAKQERIKELMKNPLGLNGPSLYRQPAYVTALDKYRR